MKLEINFEAEIEFTPVVRHCVPAEIELLARPCLEKCVWLELSPDDVLERNVLDQQATDFFRNNLGLLVELMAELSREQALLTDAVLVLAGN